MLCKSCTPRPKQPCGYCGHLRTVVTTWADGPACTSCYRRFMRAKGTCPSCRQHRRLLPHIGQQQPVCAACAGAPPGPVCGQCGNEDWLYHKDRCARCVLANRLGDLLGDTDNRARLGLQPLFDTLAQAENPETVIAWTRPSLKGNGTADLLLAQLGRGDIPLSHDTLDALNTPGNGGTANHLDAILTATGALPPRDLELARLERAVNAALDLLTDDQQRKTLRSYATWDLLRRARTTSRDQPLTPTTRHATTARLATATHLLTWLAQRGLDLTTCRQDDLDTHLVTYPARRNTLHGFLAWAHRTNRTKRLTIASRPKRLPGIVPADDHRRWALARDLLHEGDYKPADRVAGLLVLLFGQRPHHISRLTTEHVGLHGGRVTLKLGASPIELPEPFSTHVNTLIDTRRAKVAKRVANPGPWLFPSQHPDRPALPEPSPTGPNASVSSPAPTAPPRCCIWLPSYPQPSWPTCSDSAAPPSKTGQPSPRGPGQATSPTASVTSQARTPARIRDRVDAGVAGTPVRLRPQPVPGGGPDLVLLQRIVAKHTDPCPRRDVQVHGLAGDPPHTGLAVVEPFVQTCLRRLRRRPLQADQDIGPGIRVARVAPRGQQHRRSGGGVQSSQTPCGLFRRAPVTGLQGSDQTSQQHIDITLIPVLGQDRDAMSDQNAIAAGYPRPCPTHGHGAQPLQRLSQTWQPTLAIANGRVLG
jgi:hypothetical protein